ncbi:MAG: hypothetical protein L0214_01200 [candidate division NC10 bacterium]|nr:hypothetical protein [candidate division NC10 bacterium]
MARPNKALKLTGLRHPQVRAIASGGVTSREDPVKWQALLLCLVLTGSAGGVSAQEHGDPKWVGAALTLIARLSKHAPRDQHGFLERRYHLSDLNQDGIMEVLEIIPYYEGRLEFMNAELGPAFEWINIYQYQDRDYREATVQYPFFLTKRRIGYEFWLRLIDNPVNLTPDSRGVIRANRDEFLGILNGYLAKIDRLRSTPLPKKSMEPPR